jgi:hypothetical protein
MAWEKRLEGSGEGLKPFVVGQQVYSFFLFNVAGTVERGLLYPVKPVMEDIHFNQLCEESKMAVLRCNRFFHSKKNLSQLNTSSVPKSLEPPESLEIRIQDLGDLLVLSDDFCTENTNGVEPLGIEEVREYEEVKNVLKEWKAKESSNEHLTSRKSFGEESSGVMDTSSTPLDSTEQNP